jgi:hypothetical protein
MTLLSLSGKFWSNSVVTWGISCGFGTDVDYDPYFGFVYEFGPLILELSSDITTYDTVDVD